MKTRTTTTALTCLLLIMFIFTGFAQVLPPDSIGEKVYNEYKANGVDQAIAKYQTLKKSETKELTQADLNLVGYKIMNEDKDMMAAEKIFKLNMEEYPQAANPYDSYGDYLVANGKEKEAKEYFKKSAEMSKDSEDEWEKNTLYPQTKGKLAKIDKKHKQMDFLLGDWNIDAIAYEDGAEVMKMKGKDKVKFDDAANSIILHHYNEQGELDGMRIITYDAIDDEFDVAYFSPDRLRGIEVSNMKMKSTGDKQYEFMDSYTNDEGEEMELKHEIRKISDSEMEWIIFEQNDNEEWERVYAMNMTK
ncbi:hypothetical protein SAMN06296241_2101 [Salinimicrobium sediminis]|uniref:Tetratricopeptide repeat-containing protein n=1 Tax=Salinimicrobium sediminis TaxID=1343891 RepID=A0A285X800_9FLAO|nr:hypothetical protein [Salinimicrobium sediminis]SOC80549.1 hypothetical protein SAMN06296241_2101 [Salinimicrobium sediminis]